MAGFEMCAACRAEYDDPSNRRFHAQPNACPECGPRARLVDRDGLELDAEADPLAAATALLVGGAIVAIKGIGGYHLACARPTSAPSPSCGRESTATRSRSRCSSPTSRRPASWSS